jgi:hypothetical protein
MKKRASEPRGSWIPISAFVGTTLIVAGAFLVFGGGGFASHRETMRAEGLSVWTEEPRPIKPWVGAAALVLGVALVFTAVQGRGGGRNDADQT